MLLAGAIEISPTEIIFGMLIGAVIYLGIPVGGGLLALRYYRRKRSVEQRNDLGTVGSFLIGAVLASVAAGLLLWASEGLIS